MKDVSIPSFDIHTNLSKLCTGGIYLFNRLSCMLDCIVQYRPINLKTCLSTGKVAGCRDKSYRVFHSMMLVDHVSIRIHTRKASFTRSTILCLFFSFQVLSASYVNVVISIFGVKSC